MTTLQASHIYQVQKLVSDLGSEFDELHDLLDAAYEYKFTLEANDELTPDVVNDYKDTVKKLLRNVQERISKANGELSVLTSVANDLDV